MNKKVSLLYAIKTHMLEYNLDKLYSREELNELSRNGETFPLLKSIKYNYSHRFIFTPEVLAKLDLNMTNKHGTTALMELAKYGQNNEIKTLLKAGADWKLKDNTGKSALDYAKEYQDNVDDSTWVFFTLEHAEEISNLK